MSARNVERELIDGPTGTLELAVQPVAGREPRGIALVAHPHPLHGGTLDNKVVQTLARTFHALGYVAARFRHPTREGLDAALARAAGIN